MTAAYKIITSKKPCSQSVFGILPSSYNRLCSFYNCNSSVRSYLASYCILVCSFLL